MNMSKSRQVKLQETKDLLYQHTEEITKDAAHWMNFLDTACRLYRYRFSDVILIHAQKPDARSVAPYDIWSQNMRRYVKRGTKGIALIDDIWTDPHMRYVYDIADTGTTRLSRAPASWDITDDNENAMREHLIATYGLDAAAADTLEGALIHVSFQASDGQGKEIAGIMRSRDEDFGNTLLAKGIDDDTLAGQSEVLMVNSLVYMLMRRCGQDPRRVVAENDFTPLLKGLENFALLDAVGNAVMEQAGTILRDIYRESVQIANEKVKNTIDIINKESYTTSNKTMRSSEASRKVAETETPAASQGGQTAGHSRNGGQEYGTSIHTQRRLSVPESDRNERSGGRSGDREIRDNAYGISQGLSGRGLPEPPEHGRSPEALREGERRGDGAHGIPDEGTDETLQGSGPGSDNGRVELHGVEDQHREDGGGDRPGGVGVHVVEENTEKEEDSLIPEEPDEIPPGLTLPDLPSMSQQIRELQKLEEAAFPSDAGVPVDVVDEFLRRGGPEDRSVLRIIYNFMIGQTDEEYAQFLRQEFAGYSRGHFEGYRGLFIDGVPYTEGWNEGGLTFALGRSMDGIGKTRLSWAEASKRIEQLLLAGQYAPQAVLDSARDNALQEHANILGLFFRDASGEVRELFTRTDHELLWVSNPDLKDRLSQPEFVKNVYEDLTAIAGYSERNREAFRGRGRSYWYDPERMVAVFRKFQMPAIPYQDDPAFSWKQTKLFIPEDVLNQELHKGGIMHQGSFRILSFFLNHSDRKERADFLRGEYGTGGHSGPGSYNVDYDSNGIRIRTGYVNSEADVLCGWPKAAGRISDMIDQGTYLTEDQFGKLASYELNIMAERVAVFYQTLPETISAEFRPVKTGNYVWEMQAIPDIVKSMGYADMLSDVGRGEPLYRDMVQAFAALPSGDPNYEKEQQTVQDIRLYLDGKYTLFPGMERVRSSDAVPEGITPAVSEDQQVTESETTAPEAEYPKAADTEDRTPADQVSAERKNALAPEEKGESNTDSEKREPASEHVNAPASGGTTAPDEKALADTIPTVTGQRDRLEKKSRSTPKRKARRDHTETMKKYHGFPENVSDGQGQQMSLFDFMSGGGFDAMKFVPEEQPLAEVPQETGADSGPAEKPERTRAEADEPLADAPAESEDMEADTAGQEGAEEWEASDESSVENAPVEEAPETRPETPLTEEEEDLAFAAGLIPGESAFVTAQTHYLIREINFADRFVSAQDMDYAETAGGQIYQTFTFHEIRAIYERMQDMEPEAIEAPEAAEKPDTVLPELPDDVQIVARYQSTSAMQDGYVENIAILRYPNGMFYNHYGYDENRGMGAATAGGFDTLEDARQTILAHRPDAVEVENPQMNPETVGESPAVSATSAEENAAEEEELPADIPGQEAFIQERINYRIADDTLGEGGPKEKFRRNLAAIQTLKQIESENRLATAEEQEILAQYVGWGGLPQAFLSSTDVSAGKTSTEGAWAEEQRQLLGILTPEEYAAARESTLTSFYTPPAVIKAMYQALGNFGFTSGNVLEPACGVGNFMGLIPETMNASMYGVELDSISGRIARQLYQKNQILIQGFETAKYPDNFFDVVIGNVPFGDFSVSDARYKRNHFLIHDYFIAKSLDLVRPGGVVAVITSSGTMDKKDPAVRKYISERADLLGAIRLPNNTFTKNAGTTVVSDILFFQKRDRAAMEEPMWVENRTGEFNPYFQFHRNMVLGKIEEISTRFGMQQSVLPYETESLDELLRRAVSRIKGSIPDLDVDETAEMEGVDLSVPASPDVRNYSYTVMNQKIYYREDSRMKLVPMSQTAQRRVEGMIELSQLVRKLLHAQMDDIPDSDIAAMQRELNARYDDFVASYGRIFTTANSRAFQKDSSYSLLASLEILDEEGHFDHKADIFTKRTISRAVPVTHVDTASEALAVSIGELARADLGRMSELTGKKEEDLESELSGVLFRDIICDEKPSNVPWKYTSLKAFPIVTADEYLSGNVRRKLRMANAFYKTMESTMSAEDKQRVLVNIHSLESVQPEDLKASEIDVRIGATWVPLEFYNDFLYETFHIYGRMCDWVYAEYAESTATWNVRGKTTISSNNTDVWQRYGTKRASGLRLYEDALNLKSTKIYDTVEDENGKPKRVLNSKETVLAQQKQELLCEHFKDWIYKTVERRTRLERIYNEKFNNIRPREYDGSHITFVGMSPEIQLMKHQRNAVAHILYGKNTLLAHCVGAGKTYEMVAAGMECRRLGLAKKCMYVVPNHLTEQWATEFLTLYPAANILAATKKDFEPANRKRFCSRIATGDYDAIIIGHSQFEKIPLSPERQTRILERQIDDIEKGIQEMKDKGQGKEFSVKQMEKTRKSLKERLAKLNTQARKDRVVTFEELGVDRLFVDESHNYKNRTKRCA